MTEKNRNALLSRHRTCGSRSVVVGAVAFTLFLQLIVVLVVLGSVCCNFRSDLDLVQVWKNNLSYLPIFEYEKTLHTIF